jgi:prophage maintenance system killer protein
VALYAPGATFAGVELYPDLVTKARVLVVHLVKNHPLLDGNKRAAYLAMLEFLARNERRFIATGRIAIPLNQGGVRVHGIDLSPDMVAQLRTKPDADGVGVTIGDVATTRVDGTFKLATWCATRS